MLSRLSLLCATALVTCAGTLGVKLPTLDATIGCKGSSYVSAPGYGVTSSRWGHLPRGGWRGAVLGPKGDKIYGIPTNATSVLEIDPVTRSVSTFGHLGDSLTDKQCSGSLHCGDEKWIGGVLIPSTGKIIAIPYAAETVLEIDTVAKRTSTFGIVSSSVKRKWVDGVLGRNGLIYAIPYDADVVLEIDPDTHALMLFGRVGGDPCKWYGGVLAPNDKIYAIPYSSPYVLEIDPERRIARPFAMTYPHWAKWSGGVLAPNGKIYGIPALSKSVLEIDVEREQTALYGMLPGGNDLQDKWAGGVLAPNGRIYGVPWRSSSVLEFDPSTKAISLLGSGIGSANFSWSGGALSKSGRIVAVPYNGAWVLEIGESVCSDVTKEIPPPPQAVVGTATTPMPKIPTIGSSEIKGTVANSMAPLVAAPLVSPMAGSPHDSLPGQKTTFVLALLGCPDAAKASEDACFHLSHRTWHSAMVTIMSSESTLQSVREQVLLSRLSHVPTNFCFLYNGHALDPNVEETIKAASVAVVTNTPETHGSQFVVLIDNVHCNIGPKASTFGTILIGANPGGALAAPFSLWLSFIIMVALVAVLTMYVLGCVRPRNVQPRGGYDYKSVPASEIQEAQALIEVETKSNDGDRIPCLQTRLRPMFKPKSRSTLSTTQKPAQVQLAQPNFNA